MLGGRDGRRRDLGGHRMDVELGERLPRRLLRDRLAHLSSTTTREKIEEGGHSGGVRDDAKSGVGAKARALRVWVSQGQSLEGQNEGQSLHE